MQNENAQSNLNLKLNSLFKLLCQKNILWFCEGNRYTCRLYIKIRSNRKENVKPSNSAPRHNYLHMFFFVNDKSSAFKKKNEKQNRSTAMEWLVINQKQSQHAKIIQ